MTAFVLVEQDVELGQLCRTAEQLQEEKAKESGRADKLADELKGEYFMVGVTGGVISFACWNLVMPVDYCQRVKA